MSINREAWMSALGDVVAPITDDPDALTVAEFQALYRCGNSTARIRLRALEKEGRVTCVTKLIADVAGRQLRVRAYRLVPTKKKK